MKLGKVISLVKVKAPKHDIVANQTSCLLLIIQSELSVVDADFNLGICQSGPVIGELPF